MRIYPAIDLKDGQCVRLHQGKYDELTPYSTDPIAVAKSFQEAGASFLHVVDLDGARGGNSKNKEMIFRIAKTLSIPVQTGGGIRSIATIEEYLSQGLHRVILGTGAVQTPDFLKEAVQTFGKGIVAGIDAKDGYAAYEGWEKVSGKKALDLAQEAEAMGVETIIYTDIATDGTLAGPNLKAMAEMVQSVSIEVIASGGVSGLSDIKALSPTGVAGVIVGKALYTGRLDLNEAIKEVEYVD